MDLIAIWTWDKYQEDTAEGLAYHYNSSVKRLHSMIEIGETLWVVTSMPSEEGRQYHLVAQLVVAEKVLNKPGYRHGDYRLVADRDRSAYFLPHGHPANQLLLALQFEGNKPIGNPENIGLELRPYRALSWGDSVVLEDWSKRLKRHPDCAGPSPQSR
jgi:hypothetical protein